MGHGAIAGIAHRVRIRALGVAEAPPQEVRSARSISLPASVDDPWHPHREHRNTDGDRMAHIEPLAFDAVPEDIRERFTHYKETRGFTPNSIRTMARRPNIVRAFMQLNKVVLYEGTVSEELKMLVSLLASQVAGCRYCQAHMANLSRIYEASDDKIGHVWEFETSDLFSEEERVALRLAYHGAMTPSQATKEHFDEVYRYFDEGQVVEIVASIALFGFLNRWNDTIATELEDLPAQVGAATLGRSFGWKAGKHGASSSTRD